MSLSYEQIQALMNKACDTINGDMDFSSYSDAELDWLYSYTMEYKPEHWEEVQHAIMRVA